MPPPALPTHPYSIAFARERDERVYRLLDMHPVTAAMLVRIRWFPSKYKALKRLNRMVVQGRIRLVGTIRQKSGRPEHVYCRWTPKVDQLLHEIELTEFCFRLHAEKILRGPHVVDTDLRPDAEVWINGSLYYIEWDRGSMGYTQIVRDRYQRYETFQHLALWICPTELRREGLRIRAKSISSVALFTTAREALASPHGQIWMGYGGETAALPRHKDSSN